MAPVELTISVIPSGAWCLLGDAEPGTSNVGQLAILALAVGALTLVMLSTRRRIRKSQRQKVTDPRPRVSSALREQNQAARNLEEVMLELDELSRQIHGRLDTKLVRLEVVIRDADQRIDLLSRLLQRTEGLSGTEIAIDQEVSTDSPSRLDGTDDARHSEIFSLADAGRSPLEIARETGKTTGEIELILALRRTREDSTSSSNRTASFQATA